MQYICNVFGSPMSVTILPGLLKIVHCYRHETVTEFNCHVAAMLLLYILPKYIFTKLNSVALVRERTIPTERPPPVGEVSANFCG